MYNGWFSPGVLARHDRICTSLNLGVYSSCSRKSPVRKIRYKQDLSLENGKERVKWRVIGNKVCVCVQRTSRANFTSGLKPWSRPGLNLVWQNLVWTRFYFGFHNFYGHGLDRVLQNQV